MDTKKFYSKFNYIENKGKMLSSASSVSFASSALVKITTETTKISVLGRNKLKQL